ncbi:hypothetical protein E8E11_009474 [Didymella keratinophila]|nr:hypothetical protein E8E11_009474 [Didymella keratinophila]
MASVPATQRPASPPAPDIQELVERSSPAQGPYKSTIDTPPSTPAAKPSSPDTTAAPDITERMPAVTTAQSPYLSTTSAESGSDLEDGELRDHGPAAVSEVHTVRSMAITAKKDVHEKASTEQTSATECEEQDDRAATNIQTADKIEEINSTELHQPDVEESPSTDLEDLPATNQEAVVTSAAGPCNEREEEAEEEEEEEEEGEESHQAQDQTQVGGMKGKEVIAEESEDHSFRDDEDTAVESQKHEVAAAAPFRSVPPHMRSAFNAPNTQQLSTPNGRSHWPAPVPRPSRGYYPPVGHQPFRPPLDYDELQRTKAQLMKARNDLNHERKVNTEMRKTVGAEKQASIGAAMANMLSDLLQKQAEALTAKAKLQQKERDLQYREQKITQIETYLANGQKQLKYQLEQQGIRTMSQVDESKLRREVELQMKHQLSDIEGKIGIQVERLRHQEAAQNIREEQYKALIRDALENELREQLARDTQAKISTTKLTESAYERDFAEGKKSGGAESAEEEHKQDFLQGYAACYRTLTVLHNVRNGKIAVDSPEVAFLFNPTHPENPHNVGLDIGRTEAAPAKAKTAVGMVIRGKTMEDGAARTDTVNDKPEPSTNAVIIRGQGQALFTEAGPSRSSQAVAGPEQARPMQQVPPTQPRGLQQEHYAQQEQPVPSCVPPSTTFAGELRGSLSSAATTNRVFASSMGPHAPSNASCTVGRMGEGVYAGRRTIRYEEDSEDDEPPAANLIDLY